MSMKERASRLIALAALVLVSCAAMAQGTAPAWLNRDVRSAQYPQESYYSGFAEVSAALYNGREAAIHNAKQLAIGELSERVRVTVNSVKASTRMSTSGSDIDETIRSKFVSVVQTGSQTKVPGSRLESWYDEATGTAYAFAYVSRTELEEFHRLLLLFSLEMVEGALKTAGELAEKGYKMKALKQCEEVKEKNFFAEIDSAYNMIAAINPQADDLLALSKQIDSLRNALTQTIADLHKSVYIYVECTETVDGESVTHIADRLPGTLLEKDCNCVTTKWEPEADFVVKVNARFVRCVDAPDDIVFCYARAVVSIYNTRTKKTERPKIEDGKGGWRYRERAIELAFDDLTDEIAKEVNTIIKE